MNKIEAKEKALDIKASERAYYRINIKTNNEEDIIHYINKSYDITLRHNDYNFYRMLSVDKPVVLPVQKAIKIIVTSSDVLHAFSIPAFGIKIDAVPGRISEQVFIINRPGLYWGQCSELCGPFHSSMPIIIEAISHDAYVMEKVWGYKK